MNISDEHSYEVMSIITRRRGGLVLVAQVHGAFLPCTSALFIGCSSQRSHAVRDLVETIEAATAETCATCKSTPTRCAEDSLR